MQMSNSQRRSSIVLPAVAVAALVAVAASSVGLRAAVADRRVSMAFTQIGSTVVSVCLRPFTLLPHAEQEAVLIHEMLHSLGLGENPPESVAITAQVLKRCGH